MILIIDNYDSFTYNLYQAISQFTGEVKVVRNDKISIDEIRKMSPNGIVLSPGPGRPENAGMCIEIIQTFSDEVPILGVCLGHQAIAAAFGGKVIKSDQIVHGKSAVIFHNRSPLYHNIPLPFEAGRYHSLIVEADSLPPSLTIEAETPDGIMMGLKHASYPTFGVQFHPESILSGHGQKILENFVSICDEE